MAEKIWKYLIVGGGRAGASAVQGIREFDPSGSVLIAGAEGHLPYNRPPLTKELWFGTQKVEDVFIDSRDYYDRHHVKLLEDTRIAAVDPRQKTVTDAGGKVRGFEKLLLATGGLPRALPIHGGALEGISYYRFLDDYEKLRGRAGAGRKAVVIGGGFIGSEIAAALSLNKVEVTMVFPEPHLCARVFPADLGRAMNDYYAGQGVAIKAGDKPASIERRGDGFRVSTAAGLVLDADLVIGGIGIRPETGLAEAAGLKTDDGIVVDGFLRTSAPDIYAAGDAARFPHHGLGLMTRIEHWDNALSQGKQAGRNMAGAGEEFTYMPYFFSDLFKFGYEAVGEIDPRLESYADWQKEFDTGTIYYLRDGRVRGVMNCNIWGRLDAARELIGRAGKTGPADLKGAIR
jgi:3-phenylpropionate/trans-cinnamate dioxygenase ferredoxin reductase component